MKASSCLGAVAELDMDREVAAELAVAAVADAAQGASVGCH